MSKTTTEEQRFVHYISDKRKELRLTQQQLADKLGWTLRRLTSYERYERIPSVKDALLIAEALNTTVEDLWVIKKVTE